MLYRQPSGAALANLMLSLAFAALSGGCHPSEPRTQVMLIIDADPEVRPLATQLDVDIESRSEFDHIDGVPMNQVFQPMAESSAEWPFSIALLPQGRDARRSYRITVTLSDADGPIARLRAHSGFVAHSTLALRLHFSADCLRAASLSCREQETCLAGNCVRAQTDARDLLPLSGGIANDFSPGDGGWVATSSSRAPAFMTGGKGDGGIDAAVSGGTPSQPGAGGKQGNGMDKHVPPTLAPGDCGDGRLDSGEKCDTTIAPGLPGACPSECPVDTPCEPSQLEGSGCQTQCMKYPITSFDSRDGCCPMGADAISDADCAAQCGNGKVETGETCDPLESCPNAQSCTSVNVCLRAVIAGDAALCTATCLMQPIEECVTGDGCCPSTCSHDTDSDCSASCGNGVVDMSAGETCEPDNTTQPCPTSCDDTNACTTDHLTGNARNCNVVCTSVGIVIPWSGDGCCPMGANASNDADCPAICGNNIVEPGERCDGRCPTQPDCIDANPCTVDTLAGSGCNVSCTHAQINTPTSGDSCCPAGANATNDGDCQPVCGNRVRELGELCDGDCPTTGASCRDDANVCTTNVVVGTDCHRECSNQQARAGAADGCCLDPNTMSAGTDPDCPAACGNGKLDPGEMCDPCPETCSDMGACMKGELIGPDACNMQCTHTPITGRAQDGCCHDGDTSADDPDCTLDPDPVCPNQRQEPGEQCDPCPACVAPNSCMSSMRVTPCQLACENTPKAPSGTQTDDCCPPGSNANEDTDCMPECGNRVKETGETCDPCDPCVDTDNDPCTSVKPIGSACNLSCEPVRITAPASGDMCCPPGANANNDRDCEQRCGNGEVEPGEECDEVSTTCTNCRTVTSDSIPNE